MDPYNEGQKYNETGIEKVVYFDDISVNSEETNPEFMKFIAKHFGKEKQYNI